MAKEKTAPAAGSVRVKMLVGMASMSNDRDVGATPYVGAAEAERLIDKGFAVRYKPEKGAKAADGEGE